jgi:transposase
LEVENLRTENAVLKERVKELESRLSQNSKNSHLPPSRDSHKIKAAFRRGGSKKSGGQRGHKGNTLDKVEFVDEIEVLVPITCICGKHLKNMSYEIVETRQVFDLPEIKIYTKEYQLAQGQCPKCHRMIKGHFPENVSAPTQYGAKMKALCVLLNDYKIPLRKISNLTFDLIGKRINESTILQMNQMSYNRLAPMEDDIKNQLSKLKVVHADETGVAAGNKLQWMHVISNERFTHQYVHEKRGFESLTDKASILTNYRGTIIHDCWASYFKLEMAKHGICGAHLLRELESLLEKNSKWAKKFHEFLMYLYKSSHSKIKIEKISIIRKYDRLIRQGIKEEPPPIRNAKRGREKRSKGLNLLHRLKDHKLSVLAFAFDKNIPFTNNQAERDLRHCKTKLKIAGCFRSTIGAKNYARISSFTSTLRKNEINVFESLVSIFKSPRFSINWS